MEPEELTIMPELFEFEAEHQKLKEKLKQYDKLVDMKAEAKADSEALDAKINEQNQEQGNVTALEERMRAKQNEIEVLKQEYLSKVAEHANRPYKTESGFLCRQCAGAKKIEMLEIEIRFSRLKTMLLELDLNIGKKDVEKSDMDKQRSTLRLSLEKHWMETSELKRDLLGKTTAISESEDALRRQFLKEDEGINEVKMLNVQIGSLHKKLEDAQTKAEAADKEIKRLQEEIREVKKEAENDMRSELSRTGPYVRAACAVRGRKLEWQMYDDIQEKDIVESGNKVSHHGCVDVDLRLYYDQKLDKLRNETAPFIKIYGIGPKLVMKHSTCRSLLRILDWAGAMEDFRGSSVQAEKFRTEHFIHIKTLMETKSTIELTKYLDDSEEGKKHCEEMKKIYEHELEAHKMRLKRRKEEYRAF